MSTNVKSLSGCAVSLMKKKHMIFHNNKVRLESEACPYLGIRTFTKV